MNSAIIWSTQMDSIRQLIIKRRDRLGWSNETLAEKSNVPLIVIERFLEGSFCLNGYVSQIKSSLKLQAKNRIETQQNSDINGSIPTNNDGIQKYGTLSQILTEEYLTENYIKQNKSLSDIAKETNCSRQYVHKKIKEYDILSRSKSAAILSIIDKRKLLKWTTRELAEKANIPHRALLHMEKGIYYWPEYSTRLEEVLAIALGEGKKSNSIKPIEHFSHANERPNVISKYYIDTGDIDLNVYFPNLSIGEEKMLFGYSKRDESKKKSITYPKIKSRSEEMKERLGAALEHAKKLAAVYPIKKRIFSKNSFTPNFNPIACKWFETFDKVNNTHGLYATKGGEYYIEELGYFPDYFNSELKLIMEWDEAHHFTEDGDLSANDKKRQKRIQDYFPDFKFIRIKEEDVKEYID